MRIVSSGPKKRSELEHFAMWFHQHWSVFCPTFEEAASATRGGLRRRWLKLGSQGGPRDPKDALRAFGETI
jgi:hypothetical protein